MIATIVDVGALWQTIWTAALAGIVVTVCCSVAVLGAARAQEHRTAGADGAVTGRWTLLAVLGGAAMRRSSSTASRSWCAERRGACRSL